MANNDPTQPTLSNLNTLFNKLNGGKASPFEEMGSIVGVGVPQEMVSGAGQIQPVGWVSNAAASDGTATVVIDADGIHIADGAIFLTDYAGDSVLEAAGFAGSWVEYIAHGVYNGQFNAGATSSGLTAESFVGGDYAGDLSLDVPFWVIFNVDSGVTYGLTDDGTDGRQFEVVSTSDGQSLTAYQDVPCSPGLNYNIQSSVHFGGTGLSLPYSQAYTISAAWRDENHDLISAVSRTAQGAYGAPGDPTSPDQSIALYCGQPPALARYLRIVLEFDASFTGAASSSIKVDHVSLLHFGMFPGISFGPMTILGVTGYSTLQSSYDVYGSFQTEFHTMGGFGVANASEAATGSPAFQVWTPDWADAVFSVSGETGDLTMGGSLTLYDATLERTAAGQIKMENAAGNASITVRGDSGAAGSYSAFMAWRESDTVVRMTMGYDGAAQQTGIFIGGGGGGRDTNLYRSAANQWTTDDQFIIANTSGLVVQSASGNWGMRIFLNSTDANPTWAIGSALGAMRWGDGGASAVDTYLYRGGTSRLDLDTNAAGGGAGTLLFVVRGQVVADGGMRTKTKAGALADTDFVSDADGNFGMDTTNHRWYFREGGGWHYVARTAGIQIPVEENHCPVCGELIEIGQRVSLRINELMSDGAPHGLWEHSSCGS